MRKKYSKVFLAFCMMLAMAAVLLPVKASAEGIYATSLDGKHQYISPENAWKAARSGTTIVLQKDWELSDRLVIEDDEKVTVYMNGYTIDRKLSEGESDGEVIYMDDDTTLLLKGCNSKAERIKKDFSVNGWKAFKERETVTLTGGGLITGGYSTNGGGGIHMNDDAKLTLDNVVVAGNCAKEGFFDNDGYGGGIDMDGDNSKLIMNNGSVVEYNAAEYGGGGVFLNDSDSQIEVSDAGKIDHNYAGSYGGGVYSIDYTNSVSLTGGSSISYNTAGKRGGGFYTESRENSITSSDKSGVMSFNKAVGDNLDFGTGGAICLGYKSLSSKVATISGITFEGNTAEHYGGAIYTDILNVTISDCVIKNNSLIADEKSIGGGIYNVEDGLVLNNCTITGNHAGTQAGGIYQPGDFDIDIHGKMIIRGNTRGDNTADNLYLDSGTVTVAYIESAPSEGSEVGVRTPADERNWRIGRNAVFDEDMFFSDVKGYTVKYDSGDEDLDLIYDNASHAVTVNGKVQGYYKKGVKVSIEDTGATADKVFKQWTGTASAVKYLADKTASTTTINSMPESDLSYTAEYVTKITDVTLRVMIPTAGKNLATTAELECKDVNGESRVLDVDDVCWLTQNADGVTQTAAGKADYAAKYSVAVKIDKDISEDSLFADKVTGKIKYTVSNKTEEPYKIYVDENGALYIYGSQIETDKADISSVEDAAVNVQKGSTSEELKKLLPETALVYDVNGNEYTVNLDTDNADLSSAVTGDAVNDAGGTVTIPLKLDGTEKVKNGTEENEKMLTVTVNIVEEEETLAPPTADQKSGTYDEKGSDGNVTLNVKLTADDDATVYYKENDDTDYSKYDESEGISLSAGAGQRKNFTIYTYTGDAEGQAASTVRTYSYELDNPYTVTIKRVSDDESGENEISKAYTAEYYNGDCVTLGAPVMPGYTFAKWTDEKGITIAEGSRADSTLSVEDLQGGITLTAVYSKNSEEAEAEPGQYYYLIKYVVKDSDPVIELKHLDGMAEDGTDVISENAESTLTDDDGNVYKCVSMDKGIVSADGDNVFCAYYEKQSAKPADKDSSTDKTSKSDGAAAKTSDKTGSESAGDSPGTGDSYGSIIGIIALLMLASLACAIVILRRSSVRSRR